MHKFEFPARLRGRKPNIWNEYIELEMKYKPLNLGLGFPDHAPSSNVKDALIAAAVSNDPLAEQYTRGHGHLRLVKALAKIYSSLINRPIDPQNEVLVTVGAYEALFSAVMGHVDTGNEVILIEPFFDCYEPIVKMAGGVPRFVPLRRKNMANEDNLNSEDFSLEDKELEAVFNSKTKMIILNTPANPLGKVFKREELEKIAALCREWNVLCISDEVYEWIIYEPYEHIRMCTLPGMWERTITISSAGKTFTVTGWKTGWAYGPANLLEHLRMVHEVCTHSCPRPIQEAVALCLENEMKLLNTPKSLFKKLAKELQVKRNLTAKFLTEAGMRPILPQGGYVILTDWSPLANKIDLSAEKDEYTDYRFSKWMIKNVGLLGIPPSVFYSDANKRMGETYIRFCFMKKQETIEKAAELLRNWKH